MSIPQPPFCSSCGTILEADSRYCEECGKPVMAAQRPPATAPVFHPLTPPTPKPVNTPPLQLPKAASTPSPMRKRNPLRLLMSISGTLISCGMLILGGYTFLKSSGILDGVSQYLPPSIVSQIAPPFIQTPNTQMPAAATPNAALQAGAPITVSMLPNLVLTTKEVPTGWGIAKSPGSGQTNTEWVKGIENPDVYLKTLNDMGRITNIMFTYNAPGDPCANTSGALWFRSGVDVFRQADGAKRYYQWDTFQGKKEAGIGEQSVFAAIKPNNNYRSCNSKFTSYTIMFQRLNTICLIHMEALIGSFSDDTAERLIVEYARKIDGKIISQAQ